MEIGLNNYEMYIKHLEFAITQIIEFNWTMTKLQLLIDSSPEGDNGRCLTHLTKLFKENN